MGPDVRPPGVVLTIAGPGFAWALPGVAEALLDSVPLVHLTSAPPKSAAGRRFLQQELAQGAIAAPMVKRVIDWDGASDVGVTAAEALATAAAGEPGPVLLQVASARLDDPAPGTEAGPPVNQPDLPTIDALARRLAAATRPVLFVGRGGERTRRPAPAPSPKHCTRR